MARNRYYTSTLSTRAEVDRRRATAPPVGRVTTPSVDRPATVYLERRTAQRAAAREARMARKFGAPSHSFTVAA
jgi:hypothetical protein